MTAPTWARAVAPTVLTQASLFWRAPSRLSGWEPETRATRAPVDKTTWQGSSGIVSGNSATLAPGVSAGVTLAARLRVALLRGPGVPSASNKMVRRGVPKRSEICFSSSETVARRRSSEPRIWRSCSISLFSSSRSFSSSITENLVRRRSCNSRM